MPEATKRGRGRPKKNEPVVNNEQVDKVNMESNQKKESKEAQLRELQEGVGKVRDSSYNSNIDDKITVQAVHNRWQQIFTKYSAIIGFDNVAEMWKKYGGVSNNPFTQNRRIKQLNTTARDLDKPSLKEALMNPENHEFELRGFSMYLYFTNYIYQTLLQLNRNTPKYFWYATPLYIEAKDKETISNDSKMVDKAMKSFCPSVQLKTIANQVSIEGKCSYLVRLSYNKDKVNFFLLQKLNSDMVKLTGFGSKQQFEASFNMAIFLEPAYDVSMYPKFIRDTWENMLSNGIIITDKKTTKKRINPRANIPKGDILESTGGVDNRYMYWVKLPQELCYTFYSDGSHPNAFPDTIGLFNDLNDLDDYRWLQGSLLSKGVNSVLTAEVPLIKDPKAGADSTAISPDTVLGYQDLFMSSISANIFPFFAPFTKFELHSLENQPESIDIIYSRIRDLIATSGNSALLPITDKPSIASVKAAEAIQASKNEYLTKQFERFFNNVLNENFGLKNIWKVTLWGDIFYWRDDMKNTKELVFKGIEGLLPRLLSSQEETLEDYRGNTIYLEALDIKIESAFDREKFENDKKMAMLGLKKSNSSDSSSSNKEESENPVGRPKLNDTDIENDSTGVSNDMGNNVSEIKYSLNDNNLPHNKNNQESKQLLGVFAANHGVNFYDINEINEVDKLELNESIKSVDENK